ncbi:MAG: helix-hairpin-helix domain-containing protein [Ilumatobacteraceae bacterium]|nr:helix-hairpin-helix domain-containing protein [Ilumatobacteraceae bacterium]
MEILWEWWRWLGWRRVVAVAIATPIAAIVVWWMVRLPAPPVENFIPMAPTVTSPAAALDTPANGVLAPLDTLAPTRIAIHVVGAVQQPGVYHLVVGALGDDALRAAGGPTRDADVRRVNLAAPLMDGQQFVVPRVGERLTTTVPSLGSVVGGQSAGDTGINSGVNLGAVLLVDLNQATVAELDQLPGVGPSTARAIIDHRTRNGPFASVDDLLAVRGIGPAKLAELKPFVRV